MILVYLLGAFFLGWLVVTLYRVWRQLRAVYEKDGRLAASAMAQSEYDNGQERLAVLLRNQDNWAEWLVRSRIAAAAGREPGMRVMLVDGGSTDDTPRMLERLAGRFNMGFCRVTDLGEQCRRAGGGQNTDAAGETPWCDEIRCSGACFKAVANELHKSKTKDFTHPVRCVEYHVPPCKPR